MVKIQEFWFTSERIISTTAVNPAKTSACSINSWPRRVRKPKSPGPAPTHKIIESRFLSGLEMAEARRRLSENANARKKRAGSLWRILRAGYDQFFCAVPSTNSRTPVPRPRASDEIRAHEMADRPFFLQLSKRSNQSA